MRYQVRKANGVWHVFDTENYAAVDSAPANQKHAAIARVAILNAQAV